MPNDAPAINLGTRAFDMLAALILLFLLLPVSLLCGLAVCSTSAGPALYWSDRIGRNNKIFSMPKFRTMRIGTPAVATHLLQEADAYLTPVGGFLRKTSLDEIPQLWSVLKGDMSLVGPRPALYNQRDLMEARTAANIHILRPGITGWAQVNGRDELSVAQKVELDTEYLQRQCLTFNCYILWLTVLKVIRQDGVSH